MKLVFEAPESENVVVLEQAYSRAVDRGWSPRWKTELLYLEPGSSAANNLIDPCHNEIQLKTTTLDFGSMPEAQSLEFWNKFVESTWYRTSGGAYFEYKQLEEPVGILDPGLYLCFYHGNSCDTSRIWIKQAKVPKLYQEDFDPKWEERPTFKKLVIPAYWSQKLGVSAGDVSSDSGQGGQSAEPPDEGKH